MTTEEMAKQSHERLMTDYDSDIKQIVDKMFRMQDVSTLEMCQYIEWEMKAAMDSLPPESNLQGKGEGDGFHAGCCVLRAYATLLKVKDRLKSQ